MSASRISWFGLNEDHSLLDASGNDGDRGVLIASFAEALVLDGNPHDYITLLDRIVDDYDSLFDGITTLSLPVG